MDVRRLGYSGETYSQPCSASSAFRSSQLVHPHPKIPKAKQLWHGLELCRFHSRLKSKRSLLISKQFVNCRRLPQSCGGNMP